MKKLFFNLAFFSLILATFSCNKEENLISPPIIHQISPLIGRPGSEVNITGSGFESVEVFFGEIQAVIISSTSNQLIVNVPATATSNPISISNDGGSSESVVFRVNYPVIKKFIQEGTFKRSGGSPLLSESFYRGFEFSSSKSGIITHIGIVAPLSSLNGRDRIATIWDVTTQAKLHEFVFRPQNHASDPEQFNYFEIQPLRIQSGRKYIIVCNLYMTWNYTNQLESVNRDITFHKPIASDNSSFPEKPQSVLSGVPDFIFLPDFE